MCEKFTEEPIDFTFGIPNVYFPLFPSRCAIKMIPVNYSFSFSIFYFLSLLIKLFLWVFFPWSIGCTVRIVQEFSFQIRSLIPAHEVPQALLQIPLLWFSYHSKLFVGKIDTLSLWIFFTELLQTLQTHSLILMAWLFETKIEFYKVPCK